jgi:hypothetical protein
MGLEVNVKESISFLKGFHPEDPWILTSIVPDGRIDTRTFMPKEEMDVEDWLLARSAMNIYFHVNPMRRKLDNKASKEDVERLAWLHVDIDPRAGEDPEEEKARALRLLKSFHLPPTVIVDSGGGLQGFWKLNPSDQLGIFGSVEKAQELELYNIQLEKEFQADHCHNVDRIMRLPGTINHPTKRKAAKGRKPVLARLLEWDATAAYDISRFKPAVRVQTQSGAEAGKLLGGTPKIRVTGNVPNIGTEELKEWAHQNGKALMDHTLALIATGQDPLDPTKYPSRSEALFKVCCDLVRTGVPDEMIYAVIMGPNEIASSVLDKPDPQSYALRQIERAKEEAVDPWLRELNEKFAVIGDLGGKCRIIYQCPDPAMKGRTRISKQSFEDFRNRYRNKKVVVGVKDDGSPIEKRVGDFWIDHPLRRQYDTLVFAPGREVSPDVYNLWQGFACDALPGGKHLAFLHHLRDNVCKGDEEHYSYLVGWMARAVQNPDGPGEVAVVFRGRRGTGKSVVATVFGSLFGRHYMHISDSKHLVGNFNVHLRDCCFLFGDEAFFAGDKRHESVLKTLITEETLVIEGKGVDVEIGPNYIHLMLASNEEWVVPAGLDERRFFVLEVGDGRKEDHAFFKQMKEDLDHGGRENLLHYLMTYDLEGYEVRKAPKTIALQDQKLLSMTPETQWLYDRLLEGRALYSHQDWQRNVIKDIMYKEYLRDITAQGIQRRMNPTWFGRFMAKAIPGLVTKTEVIDFPAINDHGMEIMVKRKANVYHLPPLEEIRAFWDKNFGGPFNWPEAELVQDPLTDVSHKTPF